ncbi:hypothetical protein CMV_003210 [Castanea mollissima]|uniref:Uncharacterized protein n=1 Tax=Castanea mollissima TaxID=60419 RepID=A0A8J4RZS2_9ROSI|nr:hypothetical protein CMV_003210 [Castanea mollissima]
MKIFDRLQFINLADSSNLIISPDFTGVPNLKKLVLAGLAVTGFRDKLVNYLGDYLVLFLEVKFPHGLKK